MVKSGGTASQPNPFDLVGQTNEGEMSWWEIANVLSRFYFFKLGGFPLKGSDRNTNPSNLNSLNKSLVGVGLFRLPGIHECWGCVL